ncbi:MAG: NAD(P)-dependent oxidoreductase, partial [Myxococcota bacterium]
MAHLGFPVTGWARSPKQVDGLKCISGMENLSLALNSAEILVLLLPFTAETENLLNQARIAELPKGVVIINPGRGPLIDD